MSASHNPRLSSSRRRFIQASSAALAAGALASPSALGAWAQGQDIIKVGLIGCGGRGSGAARQALRADPGVRLVAMADAFSDRLEASYKQLKSTKVSDRILIDDDHKFTGFDAGKRLIESDVDVVLLCEPPHFRPMHFEMAINAGKHVFAEKPVAVDGAGVRSILATVEKAKAKKLNVVSGLCWRYDNKKVATINQVLEGRIGDVVAMQCTYNTGTLWFRRKREECSSEMEYQLYNWLYYTWLSGDHIAEQHIHSLDKMPWAMGGEYPVKVTANGGRQVRTDPKFGDVYDHFNCVFEWKSGVKAFASCRQMAGAANDVSDHIFGTKGTAHVFQHKVTGENPWKYDGPGNNMYQEEHDQLFKAIREGRAINNGDYMAKTTLMAIMGRMAAYTGQVVSFDQALNSQERLVPAAYKFGDAPEVKVARPGITPLR